MDKLLETILTSKRCHNSTGELTFLKWLHDTTKDMGYKPEAMAEGCIVVENGPSKVLFSCHVDTVHTMPQSDGTKQSLFYDAGLNHVFLADKKEGCLGADDGAGIYILLRMLENKVPGTYIFHRGEERGGIGSNAMALKHKDWLKKFDQCVAFDRAGTQDIIITQGGTPCGSPAYADSLAKALLEHGLPYSASHRGSFTDSKVYRHIIPECINLSVGYEHQHGPEEYQDFEHLKQLTAAAIKIDWSKLTIARKPEPERIPAFDPSAAYDGYMGQYSIGKKKKKVVQLPPPVIAKVVPKPALFESEDLVFMNYEEILEWAGDELLTDAIVKLMVSKAETEARAETYRQLLGL